jgi:predicted Zn finger-like uncharacterized protein
MVKVECDGCKSLYQVDERRIPPAGLKMRCPKCGKSLLVTKDGAQASPRAPAPPAAGSGGRTRSDTDLPTVVEPGSPAARAQKAAAGKAAAEGARADLDADLPAVAAKEGRPREAPAPEARVAAPAPRGRPQLQSFGELDAIIDLPAPSNRGSRAAAPEVSDLPAVPERERAAAPALKQAPGTSRRGTLGSNPDLSAARDASRDASADLPARAAPRAASEGFGELDLPAPAARAPAEADADLPQAARKRGPPPTRKESFGEIDLPLASGGGAAAAAAPSGPTQPSPEQPKAPERAAGVIDVDFGPVKPQAAPPPPAREDRGAARQKKEESDLAAIIGAPKEAGLTLELADAPLAPPPRAAAQPGPGASDRASSPGIADRASSPGIADRASSPGILALEGEAPGGAARALDLAPEDPRDLAREAAARQASARGKEETPEQAAPPKRTMLKGALVASLLIIGGASLTLVPDVGAFGWHFIGDRVNASTRAAALEALRKDVQAELDLDTAASTAAALSRAREAQLAMPRHRPTAAYAAFVAFAQSYRFGPKGGESAFGKQLLVLASTAPGDALDLALAAQELAAGRLEQARATASALVQREPGDVDAAVIAAEVELAARAKEQAVAAWKGAVGVRKSARTLYGLARAELAAENLEGAEANARAAVGLSPEHVGAHTLIASVIWRRDENEVEALALLGKVTGEGDARRGASDAETIEAQTVLGEIHLARSRISAAEQAFTAALKIDPQAMGALVGSGELFYRAGRYSEALARFEAATRADAGHVLAQVGAAKTLLALERMKEAKDLLAKVRKENPKSSLVAYWQGRTEEALGSKKEAETAYADAISSGGSSREVVRAYVALAYLLSSQGRNDEAAAKLAEASAKFPDLPALHKAKGELLLQTGRYEEAKREFEAALAREDDLGARFRLGVALRRMRAFDDSAAVFDKVAAVDKEFPGLALERGILFEETGKSDEALAMYTAALQKAPDDVDLKLRVGSAQVVAGQAKRAEPILREVLKARPASAEANHFLGRALLMKGTGGAEAMRFLERAVEIDPNRAEYHLYVGWAANEAGDPGRAETALAKALELDRELADAYWQRGVLLQKQGATLDAMKDLQTALEKRPSRHEIYATLALCYQDQGRFPEAEEAFRKAVAANDTVPEWHYRLGKIYTTRGNRPGAVASLEKAVSLATQPDRAPPVWLFDAHFLLAEALRMTGQAAKAIEHYRSFLMSAPKDNAYRIDAERALQSLGAPIPR